MKTNTLHHTTENKTRARKRMVTRTVTGTEAEVQIVTISASEITTIKVTVGGTYEDADKLLKAIKKQTETNDIKVLQVLTREKIDKCYGMLESEFIKLAKELDPETRKALELEEATADTTESEPEATAEPEAKADKKGKRGNK